MNRRRIAAAGLLFATLALGVTGCSDDTRPPADRPASSEQPTVTTSVFGPPGNTDLIATIHRDNATAIVGTVERRGGSADQARAALLAAEAETGWRSGLAMAPPAVDIRDIFGWRFSYNIGADSPAAVEAATETFMNNAAAVSIDAADPVAYALAVQRADSRGYDESEHFYKSGETAEGEYAAALTRAQDAYAELRPSN